MHYHNPFHQKRHTTKASHGIKFVTSITTTIALILVCALAVSQIIPTDRTDRSAKVAQGKTTRSKKPVKTTFTPASGEFRGVWISFQDIGEKRYTKKQFENFINKTFDNCKKNGFNAVIVHVRPFADALYPSSYFPWSRYVSGKAGKHPGFDPLSYAVSAAHKRGLAFHAWINPYRIASNTTNVYKLPKKSIARKWAVSKKASKRRNVLKWDGKLYFNPASKDVQNLVCNGVREIVRDYAVDGIHFDDYFYPNLGAKYKKVFDYKEYKAYAKRCKKKHKKKVSIVTWRRNNVSNMLKRVRTIVHRLDNNCVFGISPAAGFVLLGIVNCAKASKMKLLIPQEQEKTEKITQWLSENITDAFIEKWTDWIILRTSMVIRMSAINKHTVPHRKRIFLSAKLQFSPTILYDKKQKRVQRFSMTLMWLQCLQRTNLLQI